MGFHRLTAPSYFGGLPGGYDYINNLLSGTPATADGAKVGGPNAGSYFHAFGEDATSNNFNRPILALAQNADYLDDLMHRDIAIPVMTNLVTSDGTATYGSVTTGAGTFVGVVGTPNTPAGINTFVEVLDDQYDEITVAGTKLEVTSITGATVGTGFSAGSVTFNFNANVPNGVQFRVVYATRSNLASLPSDAFTNIKVRGAQEIPAAIEEVLSALQGPVAANTPWNDPWMATIYDLVHAGLDERYRHATQQTYPAPESYYPAQSFIDDPGAGAWVIRDGAAITIYAKDAAAYSDPINGLLSLKFLDTSGINACGSVGLTVYGARKSGTAITGETNHYPGAAAFLHLWPHFFQSSLSTINPFTRIVDGAAASIGLVGAYNIDSGEAIVQVTAANNYFRSSGKSAVSLGYDLLEFSPAGGGRETFVIVAHGASTDPTNTTKVRIRRLDGTVPNLTTTGTIRWVSTTMLVGDGAQTAHKQAHADVAPGLWDGFFYQVPPALSSVGGEDNITRTPPIFSAKTNTASDDALRWGGFNSTDSVSRPVATSSLTGDGGMNVNALAVFNDGIELTVGNVLVDSGNVTVTAGNIGATAGNVTAAGSSVGQGKIVGHVLVTDFQDLGTHSTGATLAAAANLGSCFKTVLPLNGQAITINVTGTVQGQIIYLLVDHTTDSGNGPPTITWGGDTHNFSGNDSQVGPDAGYTMYIGVAFSNGVIHWNATRY